jgi:TRAP-type C4-dicarboxylate transport system substrate-binding protein
MKKRHFSVLAIVVSVVFVLSIPIVSLAADMTLKLGHVAPPGPTTHDVSSKKIAERIGVNTGGKVEVKVFGNSQFGGLHEHWGQIKTGAIDLFVQDVSAAFMVEPDPKNFYIMAFPYVFKSQDHFRKFLKSDLFKTMMAKVEKSANVKFIGYLGDRVPRGFTTTSRRVTTPDEIKGLKLRVPEVPPFVLAYKAWGANPTPVAASEVYSSVKGGMVVGMDQDLVSTYSTKIFEIQKYFTAIDYMRSGMGFWMNADKWNALPKDVQAAFLKSVQETEAYVNDFTVKQEAEAEEGVKKTGMEVIHPNLKPWMELTEKEVMKNDGKAWEQGLHNKIQNIK